MKRFLSLVLVTAMLLSMVAVAPFYSSAVADRVGTEAYYFGGTVEFSQLTGTGRGNKQFTWEDPVPVLNDNGDASKGKLLIDGIINEGEWGNPSFVVDSKYAATNNGFTSKQNGECEVPSAENSYFYYNEASYLNADRNSTPLTAGMNYKVYLMWDEDYLYVAADVYDTSGHKNTQTGSEIWDGDVFQFRVDKEGSYTLADGYNPYGEFDADGNRISEYPWSNTYYRGANAYYSEVPNFIVGYSTSGNGVTVARDNANRYYPHDVEVDNADTPEEGDTKLETNYLDVDVSTDSYDLDVAPDYDTYLKTKGCAPEVKERGPVYAVAYSQKVKNESTGKDRNDLAITQYEIAVPWDYINDAEEFFAKEGIELGLSTMVIDRQNSAATSYGAFLEWGNGINNHRTHQDYQTCNGSNSLVLSAKAYNERDYHEHVFVAASCEAPETCIVEGCGYQRGFVTGHDYEIVEYKLPTASENGYTTAQCTVCGDKPTSTLAAKSEDIYRYFYRDSSYVDLAARFSNSNAFATAWAHHTWTQTTENGEVKWESTAGATVLTDYADKKNVSKTSLWLADQVRPQIDEDVTEMLNPYGFAVLDITAMVQTGTYFHFYDYPQKNYAVNMQVDLWNRFTQAQKEKEGETGYHDSLVFWFGENLIEYAAGLYIVEDKDENDVVTATQAFFAITPAGLNSANNSIEEFKERALDYKEVDLEELQIGMGTWNQFTFFVDLDAHVALLFWDGEYVAGAYDVHFERAEGENTSDPIMRLFNMSTCVTDLEIGNTSIAANHVVTSGNMGGETPDTEPVESDTTAIDTTAPVESDTVAPDTTVPVESDTVAPDTTAPVESDTAAPDTTAPVESDTAAPDTTVPDTEPVRGSYENPYILNVDEEGLAITIAPDSEVYVKASNANNTVVTVTDAAGEFAIWYLRQPYSVAGASFNMVSEVDTFAIMNTSDAESVVTLTLTAGGSSDVPNSPDNPELLEFQAGWFGGLSAYGSADLAEANQGYYFKVVAPGEGKIVVGVSANDAEWNSLGWIYCVNNLTKGLYGDNMVFDGNPDLFIEPTEYYVSEGDEIIIFAATFNAADPWKAPAGTVDANISFAKKGDVDYPDEAVLGDNNVTIEAGCDGYHYQWVADKAGKLTIKMNDAEGWQYTVSKNPADIEDYSNYYYGDLHYYNDDPVVSSETIYVQPGDVVTVMVNTLDPKTPWEAPAGEISWNLSFEEVIAVEGFTLLVSSEEIDGKLHVYVDLLNNPGIWSIAATLNYNVNALELLEVVNGTIFAGEGEYVDVPAVDGAHRYFANGESDDFANKVEDGRLVEYVFEIKNGKYDIDVTVNADDVFNSDLVNQELTVINTVESVETSVPGDVDGDGDVTASDITSVIKHMKGVESFDNADVDGDGDITASDITAVIKIMKGN